MDWGSNGKRKPTDYGARIARDQCYDIARELGIDPLVSAKLMTRLGEVIADRLSQGELFGIPGVGVFYVLHQYGRKRLGKITPHKGRPRFRFSPSVKLATASAPNKGTPHERYALKSQHVQSPSANARRGQELPGGFHLTRAGTLEGIRSPAGRTNPARERHTFPQIGFAGRLNEVSAKARFRQALKRAAKAAG